MNGFHVSFLSGVDTLKIIVGKGSFAYENGQTTG